MPPLPFARNWYHKMSLLIKTTMDNIFAVRAEQTRDGAEVREDQIYRGLEYFWYGIWNCALVWLCFKTKTLVPCPQRWISRMVRDIEDREVRESLVPDFILLRIAEQMVASGYRLRNRLEEIFQQIVMLVEIKCPPTSDANRHVLIAIQEAHEDLEKQANLYFASPESGGEGEKDKTIIGISAAGQYWSWEYLTPSNLQIKPLSKNQDSEYKPPKKKARTVSSPRRRWNFFKLGTLRSDREMEQLIHAINGLPGSDRFVQEPDILGEDDP